MSRFRHRTAFFAMLAIGVALGVGGRWWRIWQQDYEGNLRLRMLGRAYVAGPRVDLLPAGSLSWRVHLLPTLGEHALYQRFHLDEPWDSPHNAALLPEMPAIYRVPESAAPPGWTAVFCAFRDAAPREPSHYAHPVTFFHGYDEQCVPWTKPDEPTTAVGARRQAVLTRGD